MDYPYYYIIKNGLSQPKLQPILEAVADKKQFIEQIRDTKHEKSRKIELALAPLFGEHGYLHSVTNRQISLFPKNSQFEVDFYNPISLTAIEIERSNLYTKVWLALYKMLESPIIEHGLIMVPWRRFVRNSVEMSFELTYKRIRDNTDNLLSHLKSLTVIGY